MKSEEEKGGNIFDAYTSNLNMLLEEKLIFIDNIISQDTYICPICLEHFDSSHLNTNNAISLTLEHVPPVKLGGKATILTCKKCNNESGSKIESYLTEQLTALEGRQRLPGSETNVLMKNDEYVFRGKLIIDLNSDPSVFISNKNNDKRKIELYTEGIAAGKGNKVFNIEFRTGRKMIKSRIDDAILKISYLKLFEASGHLFINNNIFYKVRRQILQPEYNLYSFKSWTYYEFPERFSGTYLLRNYGLDCFVFLLNLKTEKIRFPVMSMLPVPFLHSNLEEFDSKVEFVYKGNTPIRLKINKLPNDLLLNKISAYAFNNLMRSTVEVRLGF